MEKLSASTGWQWVRDGFALFRKQPAEMSTLFLSYLFLMMVVGIIPLLGQVLPILLVPVFSVAFMQACVQIEQGERVFPSMLLRGFRSPAFIRLLQLGVLYLIAAIVAIAASSVVDGGVLWKVMSGQMRLDGETVRDSNISTAMLFAGIVYLPASMAFWHAGPLIFWQNMGLSKALFYSFFAVLRQWKAFLLYAFAWICIGVMLPSVISSILALLFGHPGIAMIILLPLSLLMTVVMYCSFYPTYVAAFGRPQQQLPVQSDNS